MPHIPLSCFVRSFANLAILFVALGALAGGPVLAAGRDVRARVQIAAPVSEVAGTVVDPTGAAIAGARVTLASAAGEWHVITDHAGHFRFENVPAGALVVTVTLQHFLSVTRRLNGPESSVRIALQPAAVTESVVVRAAPPAFPRITTATRTETPLRDVPQAVTVIGRDLIDQVSMQGMADVMRYVPGVGMAQGEGHRDAPIFRGYTSTSDFFVDGVRDDAQYLRDVYNVERVEVLKGPNGMVFGRGGVGGIINRVTRQANWLSRRELSISGGSWGQRRLTGDVAQVITSRVSTRLTGLFENSDTYRTRADAERYGLNPTIGVTLGPNTTWRSGYEFFRHDRTVDRGVPSFQGAPLDTDPSTFFGNTEVSPSRVTVNTVNTTLEHRRGESVTAVARVSYADYDKFYQNLVPGAVNVAGTTVSLSGYNNGTTRQNLFSQTDLILRRQTGAIGHTLLAGIELGRQETDNRRQTAFFPSVGPTVTSISVPVSEPTTTLPVEFRPAASDANNHGVARTASAYVQEQMVLSSDLQIVMGLRYDSFRVDLLDRRSDSELDGRDDLVAPRVGVVYKPASAVSLYGNYSVSYLPRAGEQLASLTLTNQALDPEEFRNVEFGAKWELSPVLAFSTAVYQLKRGNVVVTDPLDPTVSHLVDAERSRGVELELSGRLMARWTVQAGYALQDGEITRSLSATVVSGASLGQVPRHTFSIWNQFQISSCLGTALGVVSRSESFVATDNTVVLPAFTRVDGALFVALTERLRLQMNLENLLDERYYATAHSNNNIMPGSPRSVRVGLTTRF